MRVGFYMKLTLSLVRSIFSPTDYENGMQYYRQNRVCELECVTDGAQYQVDCIVRGSREYEVRFMIEDTGSCTIQCSCPRFSSVRRCKHIAAAMIAYVKTPDPVVTPTSDRYATSLLQKYLQRSQRQPSQLKADAHLVPQIQNRSIRYNDYPAFSFRVGREKLYVVRNIQDFLSNVDQRKIIPYGKALTLDHSIEQFDPRSQKMISLLMNEYGQYRSMRHHYSVYEYRPPNYEKNEITLSGDSFDRWFDLLCDQPVATETNGSIQFVQKDPQVKIRLQKNDAIATLSIITDRPYEFFGNSRSLYALAPDELLRCSTDFQEKIYPLLSHGQSSMQMAVYDLPTFCSCVLPEIEDKVTIEDPEALLRDYLPDECTPCFYFDLEEESLTLKLTFRYGEKEFPSDHNDDQVQNILRNKKVEQQAIAQAKRHFIYWNGQYSLDGEDAVFNFLTTDLESFHSFGEVYISDRLRAKRIRPTGAAVGISVSDGLLELDLDTGEFPPDELSALYQSLLRRKKYHRLKDGRYLELNGSAYEKIAEMTQMLQLSPRDLSKDKVVLPAFRSLYLDSLLSDSEGIQVRRDRQFRSMIRNFKSIAESDYILPSNMESVLRPYQKTGFQWLKTLESCGFGGILADEMGLGKTLQVISYLTTVPKNAVGHPSLVVCPTSLILNWGEELKKFAPQLSFCLIYGNAADRKTIRAQSGDQDVWVTSYELVRQDLEDYQKLDFYCCILDEGQHIKNQSTLASKAV